jgi:formylglycine-generating enzyme required for sulfatase activity
LVFYAGHGVQIKGENYLPAVDAEISGEEDVPNQSLAVRQIMDVLGDAKTRLNLVFLDACRDNPYARTFRTASRGLSKENAPSGTLISFATRPGSLAADGMGKNGLYTGALLLAMNDANRPIEQILKTVVTSVKAGSKNQQEPWMEGSIEGEFCFGDCTRVVQSVVPEMSAAQLEEKFWDDAKAAGNRDAFEAYLGSYPKGRYANLARANIARLSKDVQLVSAPPVVAPVITPPVTKPVIASPVRLPGGAFKDCDDCPEIVAIPAGSFLMGSKDDPFGSSRPSSDETPQHAVSIKAFSLGKFEVTQEQWFALMGNLPSNFKGRTLPVEQVSWDDAQAFVKKLSEKTGKQYRLPSEAEWEYACRAGGQAEYCGSGRADDVGWYDSNSGGSTRPVGGKQANAWGLHDMSGNVWEWTEDCFNANYNGAPTDGRAWTVGDCSQRVVRGGSWVSLPLLLRAAFRDGLTTANRLIGYVGFRVSRDN